MAINVRTIGKPMRIEARNEALEAGPEEAKPDCASALATKFDLPQGTAEAIVKFIEEYETDGDDTEAD